MQHLIDMMESMRYQHFGKTERSELSILLEKGYSVRSIASALKRSPSSVSREIGRNTINGEYDSGKADHKAYVRRWQSKYQGMKIRENQKLEQYVREKLKKHWSPEQISGRLKLEQGHPIISHRVIYKYLDSVFGWPLKKYLKYQGKYHRYSGYQRSKENVIDNMVFVDQRPEIINQRKRFGDFEGDTLGRPLHTKSTVAALVERKSRFLLARKIKRLGQAMDVFKELMSGVQTHSITLDNGFENARHQELGIASYFCHSYSSWEKGSIENAFGILREYIPKKAGLDNYSQKALDAILEEINATPRKCLNYQTPKEVFRENCLIRCCT